MMKYQIILKSSKVLKFFLIFIYIFINILFLFKYGLRLNKLQFIVSALFFIFFSVCPFVFFEFFYKKIRINIRTLCIFTFLSSVFYIILSHLVTDPYQLRIDRWETIEYSLKFWLQGKYIYDVKNFMGNISSYLPGQLLILLFFKFLGNVGYIQVGSLLFFNYAIKKQFKNKKVQFFGLYLLAISLSFMYEAICKSDFISSFIISSSFILYWDYKYKGNHFKAPYLLGIVVGVLMLTRSVVIIPLILFLFKPFLDVNWEKKIKFFIACCLTIAILLLSILLPAENFNHIIQNNPLKVQGQLNGFISLFYIVLAFFLAFYIKKNKQIFYVSAILIFCLMFSYLIEQALNDTDYSLINITYLAAALPYCIISCCFQVDYNNRSVLGK